MKIHVHIIGKIKDKWILEGVQTYLKRLKGTCDLNLISHKSTEKLALALNSKKYICLDENSSSYSSVNFSCQLFKWFEKFGSNLDFVIGEHSGLPEHIKSQSIANISLSPMTFTYQMATLIFIEQCYRAIQINIGTGYHRL